MKSKIDTAYVQHSLERICQGDIFRDFEYPAGNLPSDKKGELIELTIPYLVVLTQDCDLESDCRNHNNLLGNDCVLIEDKKNQLKKVMINFFIQYWFVRHTLQNN